MNYVIFLTDEMRADCLSCYGNTWTKTPNFNKLANNGVLFEQCHVQNTVCSPSRCCMVTGQYPHNGGHRTLTNLIKPYEKNLFSYLKDSNYDVRMYGKNDLFSKESAVLFTDEILRSFGNDKSKTTPMIPYGEKGYYSFLNNPMSGTIKDTPDYQNVNYGINFINSWKDGDKPFILFLPLIFPHCPFTAPEPYYSMYLDKVNEFKFKPYGINKPLFHKYIREYRNIDGYDMSKIMAVYSGMVTFCDHLLGLIMNCLEKNDRMKDTMIIASSDHGEYAGNYGLVEKWSNGFEDDLTHVPLIIKSPNCKPGHRVKELVGLFDIMPTILETENITPKHKIFAKSLVKQLKGENGDPNRMLFGEGGVDLNEDNDYDAIFKKSDIKKNIYYPKYLQQFERSETNDRTTMIRSKDYKLIIRKFHDNEFYDLNNDPDELINLYNDKDYSKIIIELKNKILEWYISTSDVVPFEKDNRRAEHIMIK